MSAPSTRTEWLLSIAVIIAAAMTLAYPALGGGFLVNPYSDQYIAGYPFREFAAASLRAGEGIPQWNPYLMGGMPYIAAMHGDIFYPTQLLRMVLPTDAAMTWGMVLHLFLAGIATFAFLKNLGVRSTAAVVGAVSYMMAGQVASLVSPGHDGKLFVSSLLPVALLMLTWGIRDAKPWAWGGLSLVVGLGVLTPHPQLLQYLLLAAGAWGLMLAFGAPTGVTLTRRDATLRLGLAFAAVGLGLVIGAVQYMPVLEYVDWSPRAGGRGYDYATSFSLPPEELLNLVLPEFTGKLDNYWGRNGIHLHSEYMGATVLALAAAGMAGLAKQRSRLRWFLIGMTIVGTLWALGGSTPFYQLVYAIVPGTKFFRAPSTFFYVAAFAIACLAALGTERLMAGGIKKSWLMGVGAVGGGIALLGLVGVWQDMATTLAPDARFDRVAANASAVTMGSLRLLAVVGALVALAFARMTERLSVRAFGFGLIALVTVDLWSVQRGYFKFSEPASVLYASDPAIDYLKALPEPARVIANAFGPGAAYHDPALDYDGMMAHGVRLVLGYHGNELGRYQQLVDKDGNYAQIMNPTLWGLLNVQYIYTNLDSLGLPGEQRVVGPVRNAAGSMVSLFKLPGEHPYAWVAPAIAKLPDEQVLPAIHRRAFAYNAVALVPPDAEIPTVTLERVPEPLALSVRTASYTAGKVSLALDAPAPEGSALVVSENFYPGWRATVDGKEAPVVRAMYSLMAVPLPAGARNVELHFASDSYASGKRVTLVATLLAIIAVMVGVGALRVQMTRPA
ncbi:MAG: hypothetical protein C0503_03530 [Gemmatimonas sp.]|nr:hypothetical protein [Gemmatimonas sp.]